VALIAEATVQVDVQQARRWFLELESHPERYQFDSHNGFTFTEGDFGEPGARFQTRETFAGVPVSLRFELIQVDGTGFRFRLCHLPLAILGSFSLQPLSEHSTALTLEIESDGPLAAFFLRLPFVRGAIRRQIEAEVEHIGSSMEAVY